MTGSIRLNREPGQPPAASAHARRPMKATPPPFCPKLAFYPRTVTRTPRVGSPRPTTGWTARPARRTPGARACRAAPPPAPAAAFCPKSAFRPKAAPPTFRKDKPRPARVAAAARPACLTASARARPTASRPPFCPKSAFCPKAAPRPLRTGQPCMTAAEPRHRTGKPPRRPYL